MTDPVVLVVEDDRQVRLVLARVLTAAGFATTVVATGGEARRIIGGLNAQLVVLDLGLPDEDGLKLGRWIRSRYPHTAILMLTGRSSVADRVIGLEQGADDYLVKPFEPEELVARIRSILRRAGEAPAPSISPHLPFGGGTLSREEHCLDLGVTNVALTSAEFAIIEALAERPNRPVTREFLLDRMGGGDIEPRAIDYHVFHLRAKLKAAGCAADAIRTIRGVGYKYGPTDN